MAKKEPESQGLQQLKGDLKEKNPGKLYFFHGEETFLMNHYLTQLKKQLLDPLTESFNFHRLNQESFSLDAFTDAVDNLPMMAERSFVLVEDIDLFKLNEGDRGRIVSIFSDLPDYCTIVFSYLTVAWKPDKRLKKLWEAVEENGLVVEFAKQNQRDLTAWISRHFAAREKLISNELCAYLIDITGGTMTALSGEIDKICAYSGAREIKRSDIDAVVEPIMDAVVFQMTDMLSQGAYAQSFQILQKLLQMQQEPITILGAIGGQFRRLSAARTLLDRGKGSFELQKLCGIPDYPARKTMDAARSLRPEFCKKASELILETDYQMKTSFDDAERLLELLVLRLSQEAANA